MTSIVCCGGGGYARRREAGRGLMAEAARRFAAIRARKLLLVCGHGRRRHRGRPSRGQHIRVGNRGGRRRSAPALHEKVLHLFVEVTVVWGEMGRTSAR